MDLTILKVRGTSCKGNKDSKEMTKEHDKIKSWAMKFFKKCGLVMKDKPTSCVSTLSLK
jgi:hypothetical protein